jgi:hypothetical protein
MDEEDSNKIPSEKEEALKGRKIIIITTIVIVSLIILFFSIRYLYHPETTEDSYEYNGFKFTKMSAYGLWFTEIQKGDEIFRIPLRYSPREVEDIPIDRNVYREIINSKKIYTTVPNNLSSVAVLALAEVGRITGTRYGILNIPSQGALTQSKGDGTPVKTCEDAVNGTGIILFDVGDETKIYLEGNCVIVQGTDEWEIVRAADRLTFGLLGVMD